jgi:hypothetical protein
MAPKKATTVLLISLMIAVLVLSSLCLVNAESAIPKPSVPEFTVKLVDHSYDVPSSTTITTDPYTGEQTITTQPGYHVQNGTIDISVHTQKFTSYFDSNDNYIELLVRIAYKGHYAKSWSYYPGNDAVYGNNSQYLGASESGFNTYQFGFGKYTFGGEDRTIYTPPTLAGSADGKVDFKVEAFIGYYKAYQFISIFGPTTYNVYTGESSGWSNIQTLNLSTDTPLNPTPTPQYATPTPRASVSPSQNLTSTPIQPISGNPALFGLDWAEIVMVALLAVIAVLLGLAVVYLRRKSMK